MECPVRDVAASRKLEQWSHTAVLGTLPVAIAKEVNMIHRNASRLFVGFVFIFLAGTVQGQTPQRSRAEKQIGPAVRTLDAYTIPGVQRSKQGPRTIPRNVSTSTSAPEGSAAAAVGTIVYNNTISVRNTFYNPRTNQRMADDLVLASGACSLVEYTFDVFSDGQDGNLPFNVTAEVYDDDPCLRTANLIAGSTKTFTNLPANVIHSLTVTLPSAAAVPGTIWMALTFSTERAGWVVGELAETGSTLDLWSEDDTVLGCVRLGFAPPDNPWAGFVASVTCDIAAPPLGACCGGQTCSQTVETNCIGGVWQGAFSSCSPSPCLLGACCTAADFGTCTDTTEAGCAIATGLFHPGELCTGGACQPSFEVYSNQFETNIFSTINDVTTSWADDWELGPGSPGELVAFELTVVGATTSYDVTTRLWTNDPGTNLTDPLDDLPGTIIAGTERIFTNLPGNNSSSTIVAGPFTGITLPTRVWVELISSAPDSGPLMAGFPDPGVSADEFAVFNASTAPGVWTRGFNIGGFTPNDCPGNLCIPAGSFTGRLWLVGAEPTGACCNSGAGTCVDGITKKLCDGRWAQDLTCATANFNPPCGRNACCLVSGCSNNLSNAECVLLGGSVIEGQLCSSQADPLCPDIACRGASGDCLVNNGSAGCDDAICCGDVCAADPNCCDPAIGWDGACAQAAASMCSFAPPNDHCRNAEQIAGPGEFRFDSSNATTDGVPHVSCATVEGADQLTNDVWFCWTADATGPVTIQTCGLTTVDTRVAVYLGCGNCPTPELDLLQCNDDFCGFELSGLQSQVTFDAVAGENYSIRVATFPGGGGFPKASGGPGQIRISNGTPVNPSCGGLEDCCAAGTGPGCGNASCCNEVCFRDPFCCEVTWDANCAGTGEFGAGTVCSALCTQGVCPDGAFVFDLDGFVDPRQPYPPSMPGTPQGLTEVTVSGPTGAGNPVCWSLCETAVDGSANAISNVVDNLDGTFTIQLARPISTNAATTITYTPDLGLTKTGTYTSHLANASLTGTADRNDVITVLQCVTGVISCAPQQGDLNRSGLDTSIDALRAIDMLNGGAGYPATLNTQLPTAAPGCP